MSGQRICVLGLGGGGFHFSIERLVSHMPQDMQLVLVYVIDTQAQGNWHSPARPHRAFVVRSPTLFHDPWLRRLRSFSAACWSAMGILLATRPDCVLAVGTAQAVPFALVARLVGVPVVFVESVTRVVGPSRTGRIVSALRLATIHYVQWPRLAWRRRVRFAGSVIA